MLSPEVTNALFRVEKVSDPAPESFEHHTHETGDFWIFELLGYESISLEEWIEAIIPKLKLLAPILSSHPDTLRFFTSKRKFPAIPIHHKDHCSISDSLRLCTCARPP
jgi:hypothetical protein